MATKYIAHKFLAALNKHTENNTLETCSPTQSQNILSLSKSRNGLLTHTVKPNSQIYYMK